ncbi:FAD-dependent monooxygenase [Rhodospirillum sp. A1_3_36]|uniref:NAD(P)/FAD-dependent oxidoreductase n=1 Tax=Rhodospirillum sp. A1_3_36 TaxID=3391666 RepID=UPI0039A4D279
MKVSIKTMPKTSMTCDVLIVGAGPAGLSVAATLPDDISTIIVHQDKEIGKPVRTSGGSWLSDVERLGIPKQFYQEISSLDIFSDNESAHFSMNSQKLVVLDVTGLYRWIAEKSENKNRKLLLDSKFISAEKLTSNQYVSTIRSRTTNITEIRSRYIVDASGMNCAVLNAFSFVKRPSRYGVGIEYEYPIMENDPHRAILFVGNSALSGYGWIFPTPDGKVRVGIGTIHPDTQDSPKKLLDNFLKSSALEKFGIKIDGAPLTVNAGILPSVPYDRKLVFGNVIRVGDSANFATPTVGEGIRICMELGELLGEQIAKSIESHSSKPLRYYEKVCQRKLSKNYFLGFKANKWLSFYGPSDWDRNVGRLKRFGEMQAASLIRSEFSTGLALLTIWKLFRRKIVGVF